MTIRLWSGRRTRVKGDILQLDTLRLISYRTMNYLNPNCRTQRNDLLDSFKYYLLRTT